MEGGGGGWTEVFGLGDWWAGGMGAVYVGGRCGGGRAEGIYGKPSPAHSPTRCAVTKR